MIEIALGLQSVISKIKKKERERENRRTRKIKMHMNLTLHDQRPLSLNQVAAKHSLSLTLGGHQWPHSIKPQRNSIIE